MTLKAVTFDMWLTLIWDTKELEEYRKLRRIINFHRLTRRVGTKGSTREKITYNSIRLAMEELSVKARELYKKGLDLSQEDRGRMLFELLGLKFERSEAERVYYEAGRTLSNSGYYKKYPNLNPEVKPALAKLKKEFPAIKIGLISNAARSSKTYRRMFRSYGISSYFDHLTVSSEVGFLKPRREIFESALKQLEVAPEEALHVGDLFEADVAGAASIGMNSLLYTGLWHRYAEYMNPSEHIPVGFKPKKGAIAKEISKLEQVVQVARKL
ncbi:MAG TPA: HAD family hydrolase [Nitrososphaerales archaeon]|nr:HAD family hydrolase [Nitrososphaerales archaeon]